MLIYFRNKQNYVKRQQKKKVINRVEENTNFVCKLVYFVFAKME